MTQNARSFFSSISLIICETETTWQKEELEQGEQAAWAQDERESPFSTWKDLHFILIGLLGKPREATLETCEYPTALSNGNLMGATDKNHVYNFPFKFHIG